MLQTVPRRVCGLGPGDRAAGEYLGRFRGAGPDSRPRLCLCCAPAPGDVGRHWPSRQEDVAPGFRPPRGRLGPSGSARVPGPGEVAPGAAGRRTPHGKTCNLKVTPSLQ